MIDLHCHLLPGIDDGPATPGETLRLCRMAVADGITHAIVTPHIHPGRWSNTKQSIARDCARLQRALARRNIPLRVGFAAEVRLTDPAGATTPTEEAAHGITLKTTTLSPPASSGSAHSPADAEPFLSLSLIHI